MTDDLPVAQLGVAMPAATMSPGPRVTGGSSDAAVRHRLAIMSGSELSGTAVVADALTATAIMGGVEIDLREVEFTAPVLTVECVVIMGGVEIKVPEGVTVEVGGLGIMGGFGGKSQKSPRPGAPVVRVTGFALMGGVEVKVVPREHPDE